MKRANDNEVDLERLQALLEKAEGIYTDLGDLLTAMDRLYMDRKTVGQPPQRDFLQRSHTN